MSEPASTDRHCASDSRCRDYNHIAGHAAWTSNRNPLCDPCLTDAGRDISALVWGYYDLAQMQAPALSQAPGGNRGGKADPPMPIQGGPEALQREIVHVLTTWEGEIRARHRLSEPARPAPVAAWHTTITLPPPPARVRDGAAVQRAAAILKPHLHLLARIEPTAVYPTGCEDQPADMTGWQAIHHLQQLRARARATLGWTNRSRWIPGDCWTCDGRDADHSDGPLYRADPRWAGDITPVRCDRCDQWRPFADYQHYLTSLEWPTRRDSELAEVVA